jgi:hypothetical protein
MKHKLLVAQLPSADLAIIATADGVVVIADHRVPTSRAMAALEIAAAMYRRPDDGPTPDRNPSVA